MRGPVTTARWLSWLAAAARAVRSGRKRMQRGSGPLILSVVAASLLQLPDASARSTGSHRGAGNNGVPDHREFHFTRAAYTGFWSRNWATDYPKADRQFMVGVQRLLTHLDACGEENPVRLDDHDLNHYPFLYAVEVGHMALTEPEVAGLRPYLQ